MATADRLHGLPICERGYALESLNLKKVRCTELMVWHGKHKPYCCDFPPELLKR